MSIMSAKDEQVSPRSSIEQVLQEFISEFTSPEDRQLLMKVFVRLLQQFDKPELAKKLE